ncbi:hypothetical protein HispidOSU_030150 [Sigmodon hispidus]
MSRNSFSGFCDQAEMNVPALMGSFPTAVLTREDASPRVQRSGSPGGTARKLSAAGQVRSQRPAPADAPHTPPTRTSEWQSFGPRQSRRAEAGASPPAAVPRYPWARSPRSRCARGSSCS